MKKCFFLLLQALSIIPSIGQQLSGVDSLKQLIRSQSIPDTNTVKICMNIGSYYTWSFPDSSVFYYQKSLLLSRQLDYPKGECISLLALAYPLGLLREDSAAISSGLQSLKLAEIINDRELIFSAWFALGSAYIYTSDFQRAIFCHRRSLDYWRLSDSLAVMIVYQHLAQCFLGLHQADSAGFYLNPVLKFTKEHQVEEGFNVFLQGQLQYQKGKMDSALFYYQHALTIVTEQKILKDMSDCLFGIATVFKQTGRYDSALVYAKKSWVIASQTGLSNEKIDALNLLTSTYALQRNTDSAYAYQSLALNLKEVINGADKIRQVQMLSFNEEIRNQQKAEEQRKRTYYILIISLLVAVGFLLIISTIIYRNNKHRRKAYSLLKSQKLEIDHQKQKLEATLAELKSTQAVLIHTEKMASLGELTAGIAHEIQNPLNFVNNFSEVNKELIGEMKEEIEKGNLEEVKTIANDIEANEEKINHHGKRADAIVKGMLQHSQASAGKKEPTDINKLADEYLRLAYHGLRAKDNSFNVTLNTDFDESIGNINIIPQDIGRVLLNLYNNALYAVNEKNQKNIEGFEPTVSVSTKKLRDKVEIKVADNGNGIPQKIVDKIFQPFFTTKPTGQGTGLGLSLTYDIVKAHGGEIKVETKDGEGTTFIIQLPPSI